MANFNDETMYQPVPDNNELVNMVPPPLPGNNGAQAQPKSRVGQTIALAGAAGVVMGAAAGAGVAYAATGNDEVAVDDVESGADAAMAAVDTDGGHLVTISGEMTCSDSLSFSQAFAQARAALGPNGVFHWHGGTYGTYYANEWDAMSEAEQHDFTAQAMHQDTQHTVHHTAVVNNNVVIDTDAGVANVDDGLSFSEAFAQARAEVGPGGVFEWHGRLYNTYYANEWNSMSPAQRGGFELAANQGGNARVVTMAGNDNDFGNFDVAQGGNVAIDDGNDSVRSTGAQSHNTGISADDVNHGLSVDTTLNYEAPDSGMEMDDNLHLTSADVDDFNGMSDYNNDVLEA